MFDLPHPLPRKFALDVARKWLALAEQRRAGFVELYESGRWRHYYNENEFLVRMREAIRLTEEWARLADPEIAAEPAE